MTFHWRPECRFAVRDYDKHWARVLGRRPLFTCPGTVQLHAETYECTEGTDCPGPHALHAYGSACECRPEGGHLDDLPPVQEVRLMDAAPLRLPHVRPTVAPSVADLSVGEAP